MAKTYQTIQGDAWDSIAFRLWGNERFASELIQSNPEYADVLIFSAGVELRLPSIDLNAHKNQAMNLPPWITS